jgi:hypothetical protein
MGSNIKRFFDWAISERKARATEEDELQAMAAKNLTKKELDIIAMAQTYMSEQLSATEGRHVGPMEAFYDSPTYVGLLAQGFEKVIKEVLEP